MKTLGEKIRSARRRQGMTQGQLAERVGIAKPTLSNYENGNRLPDVKIISRLIEVLNIDSDYLLGVERTTMTPPDHSPQIVLTPHEENLVRAYRRSDQKEAVNRLLGIHDIDFINSFILKYNQFPREVQQEIEGVLVQKALDEKHARWAAEDAAEPKKDQDDSDPGDLI